MEILNTDLNTDIRGERKMRETDVRKKSCTSIGFLKG